MQEFIVSDQEIETAESILLPEGSHFTDDAKAVIRCWQSKDVTACPGSGKTTVLLAKLKILADRMPLERGAGVCVLSHTNVAVDEIKKKLSNYAGRLMSYPNYIGTIQSFADQFVVMPYMKNKFKITIQPVNDRIYAKYFRSAVHSGKYPKLIKLVGMSNNSKKYANEIDYIESLYIDEQGNLKLGNAVKAGKDTESARQFRQIVENLLITQNLIRYKDTYRYAQEAITSWGSEFTELFSRRFKYVFIDEYQDCHMEQRDILRKLFDPDKCCVIHIGDSDQAIYDFYDETVEDWIPENSLPIACSCRYTQEIAKILTPLRKDRKPIISLNDACKYKPVLIVFDREFIHEVLDQFIIQLNEKKLYDSEGKYWAIGAYGRVSGLKIGDYWNGYEASKDTRNEHLYWFFVNEIYRELTEGNLYRAVAIVRKLIYSAFRYIGLKNPQTSSDFTISDVRDILKQDYKDLYCRYITQLVKLSDFTQENIDDIIRGMINTLCADIKGGQDDDVFSALLKYFTKSESVYKKINADKNIFIEPVKKRKIHFGTIHSVKGQTHDATLYLETEKNRVSDLSRIYGADKLKSSSLYDYSRKLAYVGFSRPKKLLCVAMEGKTYKKCEKTFKNQDNQDWDIVDIRKNNEQSDPESDQMTLF